MQYHLSQSIDLSADKHPESVAFRCQSESLDYAGLRHGANQLANALVDQGVERGDRVGIYCNKSLESALAIYGIMKAGAAYVPIDPHSPVHRVEQILTRCGIRHLVSHTAKAQDMNGILQSRGGLDAVIGVSEPEAPALHRCRFMNWNEVREFDGERAPNVRLTEQDLAYVIFTSGSTGIPKGIMHSHHSGLSYALLSADTYDLGHGDILGNHSPLHFDMSTLDYPFALIQLLLRGVLERRDLTSLRWVLFGGEPFPPKYLRELMQLWPHARFSNIYGPAEVNQCSYYHVPESLTGYEESIPIGTIWKNTEALIVDESDRQVSPEMTGELLIKSPTMMRGYWGRPDLNAACFFERPICADVHDRFYRTGDLASVNGEGEYLFHGRKDRQVKIRGNRVELDEIESVFIAHESVEEAAAYSIPVLDGSPAASIEGAACIEVALVLKGGSGISRQEAMNYAGDHLPRYALPEKIRILGSFPRTTSDKIDRRELQKRALDERPAYQKSSEHHAT